MLFRQKMTFNIRWVNIEEIIQKINKEDERIIYKSKPLVKDNEDKIIREYEEDEEVNEDKITFSDENYMMLRKIKIL